MDDFGIGACLGFVLGACLCGVIVGGIGAADTKDIHETAIEAGVGEYVADNRGETEFRFIDRDELVVDEK